MSHKFLLMIVQPSDSTGSMILTKEQQKQQEREMWAQFLLMIVWSHSPVALPHPLVYHWGWPALQIVALITRAMLPPRSLDHRQQRCKQWAFSDIGIYKYQVFIIIFITESDLTLQNLSKVAQLTIQTSHKTIFHAYLNLFVVSLSFE